MNAFKRAAKGISKEYLKTITVDNGKEFAGFRKIEKELDINLYFVTLILLGIRAAMKILDYFKVTEIL